LIEEWTKAFGGRVVKVPGNGGCLYYALYCCRTGWKLQGAAITVASTHSVEANYYKAGVCKEYQAYLDQMLSDGTITIADLTQRYFNAKRGGFEKKARTKTITAIRQLIDGIAGANLGGKGLERSQWAGDAELYATVWYIREPLCVISVDVNGLTSVRIIWLDRTRSEGPERIVQFFPEAGEAFIRRSSAIVSSLRSSSTPRSRAVLDTTTPSASRKTTIRRGPRATPQERPCERAWTRRWPPWAGTWRRSKRTVSPKPSSSRLTPAGLSTNHLTRVNSVCQICNYPQMHPSRRQLTLGS
jgi:hypothetical protein